VEDAEDEFAVGFDGNDRDFYCDARADKAALDVGREIAAGSDGRYRRSRREGMP